MDFVLLKSTRALCLFLLCSGVNFLRKGLVLSIWVWGRKRKAVSNKVCVKPLHSQFLQNKGGKHTPLPPHSFLFFCVKGGQRQKVWEKKVLLELKNQLLQLQCFLNRVLNTCLTLCKLLATYYYPKFAEILMWSAF